MGRKLCRVRLGCREMGKRDKRWAIQGAHSSHALLASGDATAQQVLPWLTKRVNVFASCVSASVHGVALDSCQLTLCCWSSGRLP